ILAKTDENDKPMFVERLTPERAFAIVPGTDVRATERPGDRPLLESSGAAPSKSALAHLSIDRLSSPGVRLRAGMGGFRSPAHATQGGLDGSSGGRGRTLWGNPHPPVSGCRPPGEDRSDRTTERTQRSHDRGGAAVEGTGGMSS